MPIYKGRALVTDHGAAFKLKIVKMLVTFSNKATI